MAQAALVAKYNSKKKSQTHPEETHKSGLSNSCLWVCKNGLNTERQEPKRNGIEVNKRGCGKEPQLSIHRLLQPAKSPYRNISGSYLGLLGITNFKYYPITLISEKGAINERIILQKEA
jgi:hypothetical protein